MRIIKSCYCLFFLLTITNLAVAQQLSHRQGEYLISFEEKEIPAHFVNSFRLFEGIPTDISVGDLVSPYMNIYKVHFNHNVIDEYRFREALELSPYTRIVQFNHFVYERQTTPNDPEFGTQWHWLNTGSPGLPDADIDCDFAWDITTGGVTAEGDTIVVAIIDGGTDLSHPDLMDNHWYNYAEIPGNGIDDDNNGYVDDYLGWNVYNSDDDVDFGGHGTSVEGMIGAVGNNGTGVVGVNWNVKLMTIRGSSTDEATVISAYAYALTHRKKYNESNGEEGAFVVATNSSFGINFGQPEDTPLWCGFFDTLGVYGILSCGATANLDINIDVEGDVPTACPSEYMLSVTATNNADIRTFSAYGLEEVDLGAPGEDVYTTALGGGYTFTSGTSFASPTVAGIIALLYAAPCSNLMSIVKADPAEGALLIRDYIFEGVDPVENLMNETKYGGRANVFNSLDLIMSNCGPCPKLTSIKSQNLTDVSADITWKGNDSIVSTTLRIREIGNPDWTVYSEVTSPFSVIDLLACTEYEVQLEGTCQDTMSGFTNSFVFKTDGCCDKPSNVELSNVGENIASLKWDPVLAASVYKIQFKLSTDVEWTEMESDQPSTILTGLAPCSKYELRMFTDCDTAQTDFIDIIEFGTLGCGACQDMEYCSFVGSSTDFEFIDSVQLNQDVIGTNDDGGYGYYVGSPLSDLLIGFESTIKITAGFTGSQYNEHFNAWIDFDQDGEFSKEELIGSTKGIPQIGPYTSDFTVPNWSIPGITRMRVALSYNDTLISNCGSFFSGEVEDYCVNLVSPFIPCAQVPIIDTSNITFTSAQIQWDSIDEAIAYVIRFKETGQTEWESIANLDTFHLLSNLEACKQYEVQVLSVCPADTSAYSQSLIFDTDCSSTSTALLDPQKAKVYPTLFDHSFWIDFGAITFDPFEALLIDQNGRLMERKFIPPGLKKYQFRDLGNLSAGIYYLQLYNEGESIHFKLICTGQK